MKYLSIKCIATLFISAIAFTSNASIISFTGTFSDDDTRFYTQFSVTQDSTVSLTSLGYAGGVNGEGTVIADGGFDSQLFIFDASGSLLESDDDGSSVLSVSSNRSYDAFISIVLGVGDYTVVMTQYNSDYLSGDLVTGSWSSAGTTNFVDFVGSQRNGNYAFDIAGDFISDVVGFDTNPNTDVNSPSGIALLGLSLVAGFGFRRKAHKS